MYIIIVKFLQAIYFSYEQLLSTKHKGCTSILTLGILCTLL